MNKSDYRFVFNGLEGDLSSPLARAPSGGNSAPAVASATAALDTRVNPRTELAFGKAVSFQGVSGNG